MREGTFWITQKTFLLLLLGLQFSRTPFEVLHSHVKKNSQQWRDFFSLNTNKIKKEYLELFLSQIVVQKQQDPR